MHGGGGMSGFKRFGGVRLGAARSGIRGIGRGQYRWVAGAVAVVLVLPLTGTPRVTAAASASGLGGPKLRAPRVDKVKPFVARAGRADAALARKAEAATAAA